MNCGNCGNPLPNGANVCPNCGTPIIKPNNNKNNKNNNNIVLLILIGIVCLIVGLLVGFFTGSSVNKNSSTNNKEEFNNIQKEENKAEEVKKNTHLIINTDNIKYVSENDNAKKIEMLGYYYSDNNNYLFAYGINNSTDNLNLTVYLDYLDANGVRVDRNVDFIYVEAGKKFVVRLYNSTKEDYNSVQISGSAQKMKSYMHIANVDKSKFVVTQSDNGLVVTYKNELNVDVTSYLGVIYYKNNKIVGLDESSIISVKPGNTETGNFYYYNLNGYDRNKKNITDIYDRYELVIPVVYYMDSNY